MIKLKIFVILFYYVKHKNKKKINYNKHNYKIIILFYFYFYFQFILLHPIKNKISFHLRKHEIKCKEGYSIKIPHLIAILNERPTIIDFWSVIMFLS